MLSREEAIALATEYAHQFPQSYTNDHDFAPHEWVIKAVQAASALHKMTTDKACADPVVEGVVKKLRDRSRLGVAKYGTTLAKNNGDLIAWVTHTQEELMDAANYCERLRIELEMPHGGY